MLSDGNLVGRECDWSGLSGWVGVWFWRECGLGTGMFFPWRECVLLGRCLGRNGFGGSVFFTNMISVFKWECV